MSKKELVPNRQAPYIVVLLMLMISPNGLFGEKLRKKV